MDDIKIGQIVKSFRFTVSLDDKINAFVKSISVNYITKTIDLEVYYMIENNKNYLMDWVESAILPTPDLFDSTKSISHHILDSTGDILESYKFNNLKIISYQTKFNYDDSNSSIIYLKIKYMDCERNNKLQKISTSEEIHTDWPSGRPWWCAAGLLHHGNGPQLGNLIGLAHLADNPMPPKL